MGRVLLVLSDGPTDGSTDRPTKNAAYRAHATINSRLFSWQGFGPISIQSKKAKHISISFQAFPTVPRILPALRGEIFSFDGTATGDP